MTLSELAKKLELSTSTVSRALSKPELVAEETRKRVVDAAEIYSYHPNRIAQSLRNRKTKVVGVIVSDIQNPFYAAVVRSIEKVATQSGYSLLISNADEDPRKEREALQLFAEMQTIGIIHASTGDNLRFLQNLSTQGIPVVDIDRESGLADADTVLVDNFLGAQLAGEYLTSLGHCHIGIVTGPLNLTPGRDRLNGFKKALNEAGHPLTESNLVVGDFKEHSGYLGTLKLLTQPRLPTGLFVANNEMMAGALAAIRELGMKIPDDISLVSFDDVRWAKYVEPPLTVVAQPAEELGREAAELLFRRIKEETPPVRRVLKPQLVVRNSCKPPIEAARTEDKSVWDDGGSPSVVR